MSAAVPNIESTYLRLRPDCSVEKLAVNADFWPRLIRGDLGDFRHEYLVTTARYDTDWDSWERHPNGDEIVLLLEGSVTMVLETQAGNTGIALRHAGDFAIVPRDPWHTAQVAQPSLMLFITAGEGTINRPK